MPTTAELRTQVEDLHAKEDYAGCASLCQAALDEGNEDCDVLWMLGRATYLQAEEMTDKEQKKPLVFKANELCTKALEKGEDNWAAHKWYGITTSGLGPYQSTNDKIGGAFKIRDHFKKALELSPKDATTAHALGQWCWKVLQIGWVERNAAKLLFSEPPSTYEECEKYYLLSEELSQQAPYTPQANNRVALGDMYYQQKNWAKAKEWYLKATECEGNSENHKRLVEEAKTKAGKC